MFDNLQHVLANEKQVNPRVAGNMDGWMDGWMDGRMHARMELDGNCVSLCLLPAASTTKV